MIRLLFLRWCLFASLLAIANSSRGQGQPDVLQELQNEAIAKERADWGYWGTERDTYYNWCQHSNRLIPVYTFGMSLDSVSGQNSVYRNQVALEKRFGRVPVATVNDKADYFDQTDIYHLQMSALAAGKKNIVLIVFDGMDWHTARAAAIYRAGQVGYNEGRGAGLRFQDYRGVVTDFGCCVTSPHNEGTDFDVNSQKVLNPGGTAFGGYDSLLGGNHPWEFPKDPSYLLGWNADRYHVVTDSANAASAMATGVKTFNGSVNIGVDGEQLQTIAHVAQSRFGFSIGVATNVPFSHATPAAAYAHNVSRLDYQDLSRDLLGLPSVSHAKQPLPGMDVVLGCGWGETVASDAEQGENFVGGNQYLTDTDQAQINGGTDHRYIVVQRTAGKNGAQVLAHAADEAARNQMRLFGLFGVKSGHLPYQTANGDYRPTKGIQAAEVYSAADVQENPTLADMTRAALNVLAKNPKGFWLMIEAGDVDWACHDVNLDNAIGAILSGDEAFHAVTTWADQHQNWQDTVVIVTSDHGHGFVLSDPQKIAEAGRAAQQE